MCRYGCDNGTLYEVRHELDRTTGLTHATEHAIPCWCRRTLTPLVIPERMQARRARVVKRSEFEKGSNDGVQESH